MVATKQGNNLTPNKRVKLSDIAKASNVHLSTVSRALTPNGKEKISDDVVAKVRAVAQELGYQPNSIAASMRTQTTRSIGFVVHDFSDPIYPQILQGIESVLSPENYAVLVSNTGYDQEMEATVIDRLASRLIDGVFMATTRLKDPIVKRCRELDLPLISILRHSTDTGSSAVINDCFGGMKALTQYVVDVGYRDIAVIKAPQGLSTGKERWLGVKTTLDNIGIKLPKNRIVAAKRMTIEEGEIAARKLLQDRSNIPEVIMAVNDLVALGAIKVCQELGLRIPEDIGVSGYNDIPLMDMVDPPLTTVKMHLNQIGKNAGEMMLEQLNSTNPLSKIVRISTDLTLRKSLK